MPESPDPPDLPLAGVRVLSVEQFGAGPWATLQLADLGADVIRIEDPAQGGDAGRTVPPFTAGDTSLFFEAFNRGKRSVSLDLRVPEGREAFRDLVPHADAVFCNLRGDGPARLGLRYEDLRDVNPRIVCCWLTGFGATGPRAGQGAYDYVIQGLTGWMGLTGEPGGPPQKTGLSLVDFAAGYVGTIALLSGLWRAQRTGRGCDCDISLFETGLALLNYVGTWTASRAEYEPARTRHSAHPSVVPFQVVPAADGWLVVACPKEKFWRALCVAIGRPELLDDPRFAGFAGRHEHREVLLAELYRTFGERGAAEWVAILEAAGVPCGPVNSVREALEDPQAVARGVVQPTEHPALGTVTHLRSPLRLTGGARPPAAAPGHGEHTVQVLSELAGYDAERVAVLRRAGALPDA
jgi:crotonobetainyl-CoA:carnitine CoA-transferase CaiB-like acyl-CoA transferase